MAAPAPALLHINSAASSCQMSDGPSDVPPFLRRSGEQNILLLLISKVCSSCSVDPQSADYTFETAIRRASTEVVRRATAELLPQLDKALEVNALLLSSLPGICSRLAGHNSPKHFTSQPHVDLGALLLSWQKIALSLNCDVPGLQVPCRVVLLQASH